MRKKNRVIDISLVFDFISKEFPTSGSYIGYRIMHQCLCANNIFVDRETVHATLQLLNLERVAIRPVSWYVKRQS